MLHLPILRLGEPYRSLEVARVPHHRTGEVFVEVSQANAGLVRRDLLRQAEMQASLERFSTDELIAMCRQAAKHFAEDTLPLADGEQTPDDYVRQTSATTGLPFVMVRRNMAKVQGVLAEMSTVLDGLTRGLDLGILDRGSGEVAGHAVSFFRRADAMGVVLPSNSPGVHSLWAPTVALKTALVLKPGSAEPWTPWRVIQAMVRAGVPKQAFGYYPTDHGGAGEILRGTGRSMVFGDVSTTRVWEGDPRVEIHGPGYSKVVLGPDASRDWERHLDVAVTSILENSGRSCVNASGVWMTENADAFAEALAERLAKVAPKAPDDDAAEIAPFANPAVAERISAMVDAGLAEEGARDVSAGHRDGSRLVRTEHGTYLLPTVVRCGPEHTLANREFLFPFAAVVEVPADALPQALGPSLAVTAITEEPALVSRLLDSPLLHRLTLGPLPTMRISWDQPHEGNLFEHLYARRGFVRAGAA